MSEGLLTRTPVSIAVLIFFLYLNNIGVIDISGVRMLVVLIFGSWRRSSVKFTLTQLGIF